VIQPAPSPDPLNAPRPNPPLRADALTWTALLGRWMDFARASLALPADAGGDAWRASVGAVITLQAVTFALGEIGELPPGERAWARDKAEVIVARSVREIETAWRGTAIPSTLVEIVADARSALVDATAA